MSYPEKNASYVHKPKFIERAMKEERAEGGGVDVSLSPANQQDLLRGALGGMGSETPADRAEQIDPQTSQTYGSGIGRFGPTGKESIDASGKVHGFKRGGHK